MRLTTEDGAEEMVYDWKTRRRAAAEVDAEAPVVPSARLGAQVSGREAGVGGSGGGGSLREVPRLGGGDSGGNDDSTEDHDVEESAADGSMPVTPRDPGGTGPTTSAPASASAASSAKKTARMPLVSRMQGAGVRSFKTPRGGVATVVKKKGVGALAVAGTVSILLSPFHFVYWLLALLRALLVHGILRVPRPAQSSPALRASVR